MSRIYFDKNKVRDKFFNDILINSKLNSWKELRIKFKIPRTNLENYRNGKITLPEDLYKNLISLLPETFKEHYNSKINSKRDNWGKVKGGKNNYIKNKHIYELNRKKAWKAIRKKHNIDPKEINKSFDLDFYEIIGTFIGDGFLNKYNSSYFIQFAGDSRYDLEYYKTKIIPILSKLFNRKPYIRIKENSLWVTFHSKCLFLVLSERFKMPLGKKVYTVKIPDEIIKNKEKIISTLRGIFDTDGCIFFDKRKIYKKPYVRIALQLTNKILINQISNSLNSLNIKHRVNKTKRKKQKGRNAYCIQINGIKEVKKYLKIIGFSNKRHLDRYYSMVET